MNRPADGPPTDEPHPDETVPEEGLPADGANAVPPPSHESSRSVPEAAPPAAGPPVAAPAPADAPPPPEDAAAPTRCLNCDATLTGAFCSECGQRDLAGRLRFGHLAREGWHEFINVDRGFLHTFILLCTRPGQVAVDYAEGRRARHCPPVRYLLILLAVLVLTPSLIGLDLVEATRSQIQEAAAPAGELHAGVMNQLMQLQRTIVDYQRLIVLCTIPLYAVASWLVFFDAKRTFAEHFVFMLYLHAQMLIVSVAMQVAMRLGAPTVVSSLIGLITVVYMIWGMTLFVRQSWWLCTLKMIGVFVLVTIGTCLAIALIAAAVFLLG